MHINFTRKNDDEVKNMNNHHQEIIRNLRLLKSFLVQSNPLCNRGKKKTWNRKKGVIIRDCLFLDWCVKFKYRGWGGRIVEQKTWHIGYNSTHWRKQLWCQEKEFLSNTRLCSMWVLLVYRFQSFEWLWMASFHLLLHAFACSQLLSNY